MIISASRRTDIPALYTDWFFNRLSQGFAFVRHPMQPRRISRVSLSPKDVEGIVFWTKNPYPMLNRLDLLSAYPYYFQFTLTPYENHVEANLPSKENVLIPAFLRLSEKIGPGRVIWRYDPILLSRRYTIEAHLEAFNRMARRLAGYTEQCTISFLDYYQKIARAVSSLHLTPILEDTKVQLAKEIAAIARSYGIAVNACAEPLDLSPYGIGKACCIDGRIFGKITGNRYKTGKDKGQRPECLCVPSIDIGAYNTCTNGCRYCYASFNTASTRENARRCNVDSPLLCGTVSELDMIAERKIESALEMQISLWE
ncbi:MAG TPA: DUF1848 domain-containing protein [Clostridiales bacterium]|nr:DUF1848 domain-containing protein [Clostridiales bacterium]